MGLYRRDKYITKKVQLFIPRISKALAGIKHKMLLLPRTLLNELKLDRYHPQTIVLKKIRISVFRDMLQYSTRTHFFNSFPFFLQYYPVFKHLQHSYIDIHSFYQ